MMTNTCKRLTIFEGPDGAGKTTAAKRFAADSNAVYVHFSQLSEVSSGLARMYVEAMLPALLGYQDVVMDRCWLSELPYGQVFRGGKNRIGSIATRMLERLSMRCATVVIKCLPELGTVISNYSSRKDDEMLNNSRQLVDVFKAYSSQVTTSLPFINYDYETEFMPTVDNTSELRTDPHRVNIRSAGNMRAKIALVGDTFGPHKNDDPFYQWPFSSFGNVGCSKWLTDMLAESGISENQLYWVNSDQDLSLSGIQSFDNIIALGENADLRLRKFGLDGFFRVNHPQYMKRFCGGDVGQLLDLLKEFTKNG